MSVLRVQLHLRSKLRLAARVQEEGWLQRYDGCKLSSDEFAVVTGRQAAKTRQSRLSRVKRNTARKPEKGNVVRTR